MKLARLLRKGAMGFMSTKPRDPRAFSELASQVYPVHAIIRDFVGFMTRKLSVDRGRDTHYWVPPAQNRTGGIPAYGSHLGCLTAKRSRGHG